MNIFKFFQKPNTPLIQSLPEDIESILPEDFPKVGDIYEIVGSRVRYRLDSIFCVYNLPLPTQKSLSHRNLSLTRISMTRVDEILDMSPRQNHRYSLKKSMQYRAFRSNLQRTILINT